MLFRVDVVGHELPKGGVIVAGVPHRNWVEPVLLLGLLPRRPVWIADRRAVASRPRRWAGALAGGSIAVGGRGGGDFGRVVAEVDDVVRRGGLVAIFPEVGAPSRPPDLRRLSPGVGYLAARSGVAVVPVVLGGTHELYLRRLIVVSVLRPLEPPPVADRQAVATFMDDFHAKLAGAAAAAHAAAESGAPGHKRWRWLTGRYPRID